MMELISTDDHLILHQLVQSEHALWVSRHTGEVSLHASWDLATEANPECLGAVWGLVGKLRLHPGLEEQLVVVRECERILELPDPGLKTTFPVYRVKSVSLVPISAASPAFDSRSAMQRRTRSATRPEPALTSWPARAAAPHAYARHHRLASHHTQIHCPPQHHRPGRQLQPRPQNGKKTGPVPLGWGSCLLFGGARRNLPTPKSSLYSYPR